MYKVNIQLTLEIVFSRRREKEEEVDKAKTGKKTHVCMVREARRGQTGWATCVDWEWLICGVCVWRERLRREYSLLLVLLLLLLGEFEVYTSVCTHTCVNMNAYKFVCVYICTHICTCEFIHT